MRPFEVDQGDLLRAIHPAVDCAEANGRRGEDRISLCCRNGHVYAYGVKLSELDQFLPEVWKADDHVEAATR